MDSNPFRAQSPYTQPEQQFTGYNQGQQQSQQLYGAQGNYQPQQSQFTTNQPQLGNGAYTGNTSYTQPMPSFSTPPTMNIPTSFNSLNGSSMPSSSHPTGFVTPGYTQTMPQPQSYGSTPNMSGYSSGGGYQMPLPQTQYEQNQYGQQQMQYNSGYPSQDLGNQFGSMGMNTGNGYFQQQQPANPDNFYIPDIGVFSSNSRQATQPQRASGQRPPRVTDGKVRKVNCPICNQEIEGDEPAINHHVNNHLDDAATEAYKNQQSQQPRLSDSQLAKKLYVEEANSHYRW